MSPAKFVAVLISGALFGYGLALCGMVSPEVVLSFLRFQDFGLMLVMGGGMGLSLLAYQLLPRLLRRPLLGDHFAVRPAVLDRNTLVGAAVFGIGRVVCGVCPGPAIAGLGVGNGALLVALGGILLGAYLQGVVSGRRD